MGAKRTIEGLAGGKVFAEAESEDKAQEPKVQIAPMDIKDDEDEEPEVADSGQYRLDSLIDGRLQRAYFSCNNHFFPDCPSPCISSCSSRHRRSGAECRG